MSVKIDYKVDAKLLDELYLVRMKLKKSTQYTSKVMGLCLLGEKDGIVDSFVPMITSAGCWNAPEIGYDTFDKNFRKLLEMDRVCVGMAMIRPDYYEDTISTDMKVQIHGWRKAFADIEKTIWIMVSQHNIICYRVGKDSSNRLTMTPYDSDKLYENSNKSKMLKIAEVRRLVKGIPIESKRDIEACAAKLEKSIEKKTSGVRIMKNLEVFKKDIIKIRDHQKEIEREEKEEAKRRAEKAAALAQENLRLAAERRKREDAARKHTRDIGHGLILIKDKNGREILWQK